MNLNRLLVFTLVLLTFASSDAQARLEVCNRTDLVLMVAVGYDTTEDRAVSEGWWRLYPGYCEVPVDVAMLKGNYYVHAESNPRSTMPNDAFAWGEETPLCVKTSDFRNANGRECNEGEISINFNALEKDWRNKNVVNIYYAKRAYADEFHTKIAGVQRLLSILGYEFEEITGVLDESTVGYLNEVGQANGIFGLNFDRLYPLLEQLVVQRQKLNN